jgi:hypothetical protein
MAIDKKSGLDMIAKRIPRTRIFAGVLGEHAGAYHRGTGSYAEFNCPNSAAQMTTVMTRRGKLRRDVAHGHGSLVTNFAARSSARQR